MDPKSLCWSFCNLFSPPWPTAGNSSRTDRKHADDRIHNNTGIDFMIIQTTHEMEVSRVRAPGRRGKGFDMDCINDMIWIIDELEHLNVEVCNGYGRCTMSPALTECKNIDIHRIRVLRKHTYIIARLRVICFPGEHRVLLYVQIYHAGFTVSSCWAAVVSCQWWSSTDFTC